jgi:hypothetical protein
VTLISFLFAAERESDLKKLLGFSRIYSDIVGWVRIGGGGVPGFAWTGHDGAGLAFTCLRPEVRRGKTGLAKTALREFKDG